jgi:VIT1/CCC1 family predicted Fe2+/Mn2+ transporter
VLVSPARFRIEMLAIITLASLAGLGALGGKLSGASTTRAAARVTAGGALALAVTYGIGRALGLTL